MTYYGAIIIGKSHTPCPEILTLDNGKCSNDYNSSSTAITSTTVVVMANSVFNFSAFDYDHLRLCPQTSTLWSLSFPTEWSTLKR